MRINVTCVCCGKEGKMLTIFRLIISRWKYFGSFEINGEEYAYVECPQCYKENRNDES